MFTFTLTSHALKIPIYLPKIINLLSTRQDNRTYDMNALKFETNTTYAQETLRRKDKNINETLSSVLIYPQQKNENERKSNLFLMLIHAIRSTR